MTRCFPSGTKGTVCFGCGGPKPQKMVVCGDCWQRVPIVLKDDFSREANGRRNVVVRRILEHLRRPKAKI
jgi:hypothetical protein